MAYYFLYKRDSFASLTSKTTWHTYMHHTYVFPTPYPHTHTYTSSSLLLITPHLHSPSSSHAHAPLHSQLTTHPHSLPPPHPSPSPPMLSWLHTSILTEGAMIVFGGVSNNPRALVNDVWVYDYSTCIGLRVRVQAYDHSNRIGLRVSV